MTQFSGNIICLCVSHLPFKGFFIALGVALNCPKGYAMNFSISWNCRGNLKVTSSGKSVAYKTTRSNQQINLLQNNAMTKTIIILSPLRFYAQHDEQFFFEWLDTFKSIIGIKGIGNELHVEFKSSKISNKELLDLMGMFRRYNFDTQQLTVFKNAKNKVLFE